MTGSKFFEKDYYKDAYEDLVKRHLKDQKILAIVDKLVYADHEDIERVYLKTLKDLWRGREND